MSTAYTLAKIDGVELFAVERSGRIEIGIAYDEGTRAPEEPYYLDTGNVFTSEDLLQIIIKLAAVASYVADDFDHIRALVEEALASDSYLGSMPRWGGR